MPDGFSFPLSKTSVFPSRRCRRKWHFIGTFRYSRPCAPSTGPSDGFTFVFPSRRCRRKWHFIVTFRHSRPCAPFHRSFRRLYLRVPFQKVPTKMAFHPHLPALAAVDPRLQVLLTALPPCSLPEGADENGVSSSPSGTRSRRPPSAGPSDGFTSVFLSRRCRRKWHFIGTFLLHVICRLD